MKVIYEMTRRGALLVGSLLIMGTTAFATPVTGVLGFSGEKLFSFTLGTGLDAVSYIDFQDPVNGGIGDTNAQGRSAGSFFEANIPFLDSGSILDLATAANGLGYAVAPVDQDVSIDNFLTFSSIPTTNLRLLKLPLALTCVNSATVACVGPFKLTQDGGDVTVTMSILGEAINGGDITTWSGGIDARFSATTIQAVIDGASSAGGIGTESWSGQIIAVGGDSPVPEPGTVTMISIGLLAVVVSKLRSRSQGPNV